MRRYLDLDSDNAVFFALHGYAVLEEVAMPVMGPKKTRNDFFVKEVTLDAQAAIRKVVEMGVADPERIGVWGHSYGAFTVGNLLAHTDLFRAGIASSGAYNRTLTPDGFQDETRTLWEAPATYQKISPFNYANLIKEPLLLLHGTDDENEGTIPYQSQKMDEAIKTTGGVSKLVMLPYEGHDYHARESVSKSLSEMFAWFDKYVKNAEPRRKTATAARN